MEKFNRKMGASGADSAQPEGQRNRNDSRQAKLRRRVTGLRRLKTDVTVGVAATTLALSAAVPLAVYSSLTPSEGIKASLTSTDVMHPVPNAKPIPVTIKGLINGKDLFVGEQISVNVPLQQLGLAYKPIPRGVPGEGFYPDEITSGDGVITQRGPSIPLLVPADDQKEIFSLVSGINRPVYSITELITGQIVWQNGRRILKEIALDSKVQVLPPPGPHRSLPPGLFDPPGSTPTQPPVMLVNYSEKARQQLRNPGQGNGVYELVADAKPFSNSRG